MTIEDFRELVSVKNVPKTLPPTEDNNASNGKDDKENDNTEKEKNDK